MNLRPSNWAGEKNMFHKVGVQIMDLTICKFQIKISHLAMKPRRKNHSCTIDTAMTAAEQQLEE